MSRSRLRMFALVVVMGAAAVAIPAVEVVQSAHAKGKDPPVDPAEKSFEEAYANEDGAKRAAAVSALDAAPDALKFRLLTTKVLPTETRPDVVGRAVGLLSRLRDPAVIASLAALAKTGRVEDRVLILEACAGHAANADVHAAVLAALSDKEPRVRGMACYAAGEHKAMDALPPLLALLGDARWIVQSAVLSAITRLPDRAVLKEQAVPKLIDFLEGSSGRQQLDCADALKRITGKDLGRDVAKWRLWLQGGDAALPKPEAGPPKDSGAYATDADKPHFYGIEVLSKRAVIILDVSLSMNELLEIDLDRLRAETAKRRALTGEDSKVPGGKGEPPPPQGYDIPWWRIKSRLDLAKHQAIALVSALEPDQNFEIITFSTEVHPWMSKLIPANQANKQKAIAMLEVITPEDQTNTWGALAAAFEMSQADPKARKDAEKDPKFAGFGADEIYLVTDGAPSKGDIVAPEQIIEAALELCRLQQVRIHTIGIGVDLPLLRKLASGSGGQSKSFK